MSFVMQAKRPSGFHPRLAHLDDVEQQASIRLERLRTKRANSAIANMKRVTANFIDHIGMMREKKVSPVSFAYAFGTFMAASKEFREIVGATDHAVTLGGASPELKGAGAALKRFADEFKAEYSRVMSDAREYLEAVGIPVPSAQAPAEKPAD